MRLIQEIVRGVAISLLAGCCCCLAILSGCRPEGTGAGLPEIGSRLPRLMEGARIEIRNAPINESPPQGGWIIYAFSPGGDCPACEENSQRVEELAKALPPEWILLSVATQDQGLPSFLERHHLTVPVLTQIPKPTLAEYGLTKTPRMYLLDKDWRLLEILDGKHEGEVAKQLGSRLKVAVNSSSSAQPEGSRHGSADLPPGECFDRKQQSYSLGAKGDIFGITFRCGAGGVWRPAA